ncbi:MAG TPA: glycoside hydrolase, partial [Flavisolibacter sp.]|nr:glycoside hydrolase [Flavisolibacter sp.]
MRHQEDNQVPELWGGIECTINRVENRYFDQLEYAGHYSRPDDIAILSEVGIKKIRYPILWEKHQPQKEIEIDWRWTSGQLQELQDRNIAVIAGLVHHGSGPAFTHLL